MKLIYEWDDYKLQEQTDSYILVRKSSDKIATLKCDAEIAIAAAQRIVDDDIGGTKVTNLGKCFWVKESHDYDRGVCAICSHHFGDFVWNGELTFNGKSLNIYVCEECFNSP